MGLAINVDISGYRDPSEPELATSEMRMLSDIEVESTSTDVHTAEDAV